MISTPGCIDQLSDLLTYTLTSEQPATEDTIRVHGAGCSLLLPVPIHSMGVACYVLQLPCRVREAAKLLQFFEITKFFEQERNFL